VMQSCRGTFGSSGVFDPHHDDQRDGLATIEWIKRQSWYGGSIGTFGLSYLGYTQWAIAAAAGPEVKAMAMQVTQADFWKMTYAGNSYMLENTLSWTNMVTRMKNRSLFILRFLLARSFGIPMIGKERWKTLPLASMDRAVAGEPVPFWQDWLAHPSAEDPHWAPTSFSSSIPQIKRPITMVAGWMDIFLPWQLQNFTALRKAGCEARITIGPWRHTDAGIGRTGMQDAIEWFNWHLLGKDPGSQRKPVKYYLIGADEWRYSDEWPLRESISRHWYLQRGQKLHDRTAAESEPDRYRYDPADPTPSAGGPSLDGIFAVDNARLEARADVLTYTSEALPQHLDIIGPVAAELYVTSDARSADFFVRLCDVDTNGVSKNICDGLQRVKVEPDGVPQRVRVDLWPTAYRIPQGHRIRVQVSSGAFPRWARNLGTLEPIGSATELRSAAQSIHHSPSYPSAIVLPVCQ